MKIKITSARHFILLLLLNISLAGQAQDGPPPAAMPTVGNRALIDSIIKATHHETYFTKYCTEKVKAFAATNKWTAAKTDKILNSIKFEHYSSTVYNSYANYSTEDLTSLFDLLKRLNKKCSDWSCMVLTNHMMQNNLDLFVESLTEEK